MEGGSGRIRTPMHGGLQGRIGLLMYSFYRSFHVLSVALLLTSRLPTAFLDISLRSSSRRWWPAVPAPRRPRAIQRVAVAAALGLLIGSLLPVRAASPDSSRWTLVARTVTQDQGAWIVDYRLRHTGCTGIIVMPEEIAVKAEGWVSNSRVASHALPRWSSLVVSHGPELSASAEVIAASDEGHRCHERLVVSVCTEDQAASGNRAASQRGMATLGRPLAIPTAAEHTALLPLSVGPGIILRVRLRLDHQHILYGDYDPLLSARAVELTLGSTTVRDVVPLDREQYLAQPKFTWPEPPEERRDTRHAVSGPDSLHIEAHVPGHQYYRFPERPVRYSTRMRLKFWYLIATGTEGECCVVVAQYKETPVSWRKLVSSGLEQSLKTVGRWTKVERIVQIDAEATTLTLEFKIGGETEVGEMWIDDVSLEPVGSETASGP
jgi:hypothetical protein